MLCKLGLNVLANVKQPGYKGSRADAVRSRSNARNGLLHEVVPSEALVARALERAQTIGSWPAEAVQETRPHINANFIGGVRALGDQEKRSHRSAFAAGHAQANMKQIITKGRQGGPSWILLTSEAIPSLAKTLKQTKDSGIHLYGQGATLASDMLSWLDDNAPPRVTSSA
jgi:hypothetical protein